MKMAPLQIIYRLFPWLCSFTRGYSLCYKWHPWSTMHRICTSISMSQWNWQGEWICRALIDVLGASCGVPGWAVADMLGETLTLSCSNCSGAEEEHAGKIRGKHRFFPLKLCCSNVLRVLLLLHQPMTKWRWDDTGICSWRARFPNESCHFLTSFWPCHMQPMQLVPVGMLSLWKATPWRRARCVAQTLSAGANKSGSAEVL